MAIDLNALSTREALSAIYIGYYDRAADPAGIQFWEQVVANTSLDLVAITSDFAGQAETQAVHPFFANPTESAAGAFITTLYLNLFNREPDAEGLAFWTAALQAAVAGDEGALTVGEIIVAIIEGAVDDADAGTFDRTTILNKIEVANDWTSSAEMSDIDYATNTAAQASAASIIDGVTDQQSTVNAALATTDDFFAEDGNNGGQPGQTFDLGFGSFDPSTGFVSGFDNLTGTSGSDIFHAESGTLISGDRIDGGSGRDALTAFFEGEGFGGAPVSARTTSVESVYVTNQSRSVTNGDNNIEGFGENVEIDGGRMVGVDRWEDFDSRADLIIEDARDGDDTDGTFTGDITVAMVSTDPGNVDFAVYFDEPVNTAANDDAIFIEVIDQNNSQAFSAAAITGATTGNLTDAQLTEFSILVGGERVTIELDVDVVGTAHFGADATYNDLLNAINVAMNNTTLADGSVLGDDLTATLGTAFDENIGDDNGGAASNTQVFGLQIVLRSNSGTELDDAGAGDIVVISREDPADTAQAITNQENIVEELIRLNVELDDVGKGSMGGDAVFGAMSTGRQAGDDRTSDSVGIQQFDIEVDRSSQLQTINSTNNSLQVVNIVNGENSGLNNTTTAADEMIGDLVVRGRANPDAATISGTDTPMPGALPQHNSYGFSDVRVINAAAMIGAVDLTAELTEEIVEKYLDIQDSNSNGELDDVTFAYTLGSNNDEFFLNMSSEALDSAGTGSREDFDMSAQGGAGNDVITTNVGTSVKVIDEQGQDYYVMFSDNGQAWYENSVFTNAATFTVSGGSGDDTIWTHGWGDNNITDGSGADAIYTDNSGVVSSTILATNIDRNPGEHDPIDYVVGAVWALNAEGTFGFDPFNPTLLPITGATNDTIILATAPTGVTTLSNGQATITVSFTAAGGATGTATSGVYTTTATIPVSELSVSGGNIVTDEQAYNQAIKNAINNDQTLSQMLEASDGPGNSLIVATKIDGDWVGTEFDVAFTSLLVNGSAELITTPVTPAGYVQATDVEFASLGTSSIAETDNVINLVADNTSDVLVLSTNDATPPINTVFDGTVSNANTDLDGTSNDIIRFADGVFGSETIVNFDAGVAAPTTGFDVMDFLAITFAPATFSNGSFNATANSISVVAETTANDTAAEVATAYNSMATTGTAEAIAIVYDVNDDNRGTVYLVTDTVSANASATVLGDIELIGTDWATMTVDNFA